MYIDYYVYVWYIWIVCSKKKKKKIFVFFFVYRFNTLGRNVDPRGHVVHSGVHCPRECYDDLTERSGFNRWNYS